MKNPDSRQASSGFKQTSFLPEPEFNPIWPTPNTLPARCLSMMLAGKSFIHPEFEEITGSWRLAANTDPGHVLGFFLRAGKASSELLEYLDSLED